jgi:soluble NSF attachment protein (SNAP)-like
VQVTTWKDKVADPSNLWLRATRSEEDGRFAEAAVFYLRDAAACLSNNLGVRAALSCSCAASCLERTGNVNKARHLYFETAKMYEEQAEASFGTSIREALWLLQEAHDYFIVGGDAQRATQIYDQCASLARKSSPFITGENLDKVLRIRRGAAARPVSFGLSVPAPQTSEINGAIEGFLRLRETKVSKPATPVDTSSVQTRRRPSIEKSIAS